MSGILQLLSKLRYNVMLLQRELVPKLDVHFTDDLQIGSLGCELSVVNLMTTQSIVVTQ